LRAVDQGGAQVQIKISTRHGHISEETQAGITAKVGKLTRFLDRISSIEVTLDLERREVPAVDLRVSAGHRPDFVASSQSDSLMGAVDNAVEKMEQQLRKHKRKVQDRHRGGGHRQQRAPSEAGPEGS
jgi:putative sigma-54 modulation protein